MDTNEVSYYSHLKLLLLESFIVYFVAYALKLWSNLLFLLMVSQFDEGLWQQWPSPST